MKSNWGQMLLKTSIQMNEIDAVQHASEGTQTEGVSNLRSSFVAQKEEAYLAEDENNARYHTVGKIAEVINEHKKDVLLGRKFEGEANLESSP